MIHILLKIKKTVLICLWSCVGCCVTLQGAGLLEVIQGGEDNTALRLLDGGWSMDGVYDWWSEFSVLNERNEQLQTALHVSAKLGWIKVLTELLKLGLEVSARDDLGDTPLHLAALGGHFDAVRLLVDWHADVNAVNDRGETPLHVAVELGDEGIVGLLVENGALIDVRDARGWTPYVLARLYYHESVREYLEGVMRVHGKWIEGMDVEAVLVSGLLDEESEIVIHALGVLNRLKGLENCILVGMTNIDSGFNWEVVNVVSSVIKDRKDAFIVNLTDEVLMRDDFMMYFSMIINPGQSDSFHHVVRQKRQFQLRDLNPARMLPMEHTYHRALDMVDRFEIPYFGICSGHQHLILKSNGALMEVGNRDKQEIVVLVPGTYGEYLFLTHEERESYHQCQDLGIIMVGEPLFYHKYCGVESNVGEGVNIEGYSDSGIVHVISKEGRAFGVQWHPEGTYFQKSLNPNRHRIYIDNIFDLAFKRHERFQAAVERGVRPDDPELIEGLSSFLKQLEHESIRLCPNLGAPKFIFIDDGDIAEPTDLRSLTSVR